MEDFNQPCPERTDVLKRLEEAFGTIQPPLWAACQICDLDALEQLLDVPSYLFEGLNHTTSQMVRYWCSPRASQSQSSTPKTSTPKTSTPKTPTPQKSTASNADPSPSMLPPPPKRRKASDSPIALPRDSNVKQRAMERDKFCCVLTGIGTLQVAHIYPHAAMKYKEERNGVRHVFWDQLRAFWPTEKVNAWKTKLFPNGIYEQGSEQVFNLICLAPHAHQMWDQGQFALKPVSQSNDKKSLKLQFFWQEQLKDRLPRINPTTAPISSKGLQQMTSVYGSPVWLNDKSGKKIQSGDFFTLQTDDPIQQPLPSFELLELQWFLHRIRGMAGAADLVGDDWLDTNSDLDDAPALGFDDDVEDLSLTSETPPFSPPNLFTHPFHPKQATSEVEIESDGERARGREVLL